MSHLETGNMMDKKSANSLDANAVVVADIDFEVGGQGGGMLMVPASGTAVKRGPRQEMPSQIYV